MHEFQEGATGSVHGCSATAASTTLLRAIAGQQPASGSITSHGPPALFQPHAPDVCCEAWSALTPEPSNPSASFLGCGR
jgi:hypothetical protein